jgi:hypothetical protein
VTVGGTNIAGIALGTVLALVIHLVLRIAPGGQAAPGPPRPFA